MTSEVQLDEKWSFVGKKAENCDPDDPADDHLGDWWDHVAYDPEHRLVVCVEPGARVGESVEAVVEDFKRRTGGRPMRLITSDEHRPYKEAILRAYGVAATLTPGGRPARAARARQTGGSALGVLTSDEPSAPPAPHSDLPPVSAPAPASAPATD